MRRRFETTKAVCCLITIAALCTCGIATAQDATTITGVAAGTDYLQTGPGTETTIMGTKVTLTGVPIKGMGSTDSTIIRQKDAGKLDLDKPGFTATIPIQMTSLNLTGTLGACTASITLAPSPASTGTMTITTTSATGGTFTSTITVYYMAMFTPAATCPAPVTGSYTFTQKGGKWSTKPTSSAEFIVTGPYPDVNANLHTGLPTGIVDFYITTTAKEEARTAAHVVCEAFEQAGETCP